MSGDDPKTLEYPNAEGSPEERARRLRGEVDRLASLPVVEWMFYLEGVAEKYGVSRADLKAMVEATIRANEKKAREDKAEDRQRIQRVEKDEVTAKRELEREQASRNVSRSEPIKRLSASARSARKRSKRSPNYPAWRTRHGLLNWRSGRAKTSTSCVTNSPWHDGQPCHRLQAVAEAAERAGRRLPSCRR